jgi:acyl-CoA synthetase (AMP-forming)/AMP-acid ligase II
VTATGSQADLSAQIREALGKDGGAPAIAFQGRWRNWAWMASFAAALDAALSVRGLGRDTPVALVARNRPAHVAALAGLLATHRTTCMVYSAQAPAAVAADVARLSAPAVLADPEDWTPAVSDAVAATGALGLEISEAADPVREVAPPQAASGETALKAPAPEVACELLSSGTTGAPKRVSLSWAAATSAVADAGAVYAGSGRRDAPIIMVHPLGNVSGLSYIAPALAFRQPIALLEKFTVEDWTQAVRDYHPVRAALPPAAIRMLFDARPQRADLASLTLIAAGGARIEPELQDAFEAAYGVPVLTAFGATEFGGVVANWSLDEYRRLGAVKRGSAGRPSPRVALRIVDRDTFQVLPPDAVGLLEARVDRLGPDWIRTNDLASLDADGFLYLHGRADDAINRGGFKVVPDVVAQALRAHPAVAEAAVVGIPDARLGETPVAAVELRHDARAPAEGELTAFLRERLTAYQIPVQIRIVPALPRNTAMKVSTPEVRRLFEAGPPAEA